MVQIFFTSVESDHTMLLHPLRRVIENSHVHLQKQEALVQDIGCVKSVARSNNLPKSKLNQAGAWHSAKQNVKNTLMQASMLEIFQAHQYSHHKSKISIMTCETEIHRAVALQTEHVQMPHYLHDARLLCHSMLTSMYKTVHRENRDACGPAIQYWSSCQEPKMQVWHGHACKLSFAIDQHDSACDSFLYADAMLMNLSRWTKRAQSAHSSSRMTYISILEGYLTFAGYL